MAGHTEYKVKIIYKSGAVHEEWFKQFEYDKSVTGTTTVNWESAVSYKGPVIIGVDEIAAVWQTDVRHVEE